VIAELEPTPSRLLVSALYSLAKGVLVGSNPEQLEEVESLLQRVTAHDPEHLAAQLHLAGVGYERGRYEVAVAGFRAAHSLLPQVDRIKQLLAGVLIKTASWGMHHHLMRRSLALRRGTPYPPEWAPNGDKEEWWRGWEGGQVPARGRSHQNDPRAYLEAYSHTNPMKLHHDADQIDHLRNQGVLQDQRFRDAAAGMRAVSRDMLSNRDIVERSKDSVPPVGRRERDAVYALTNADRTAMGHLYNRVAFLPPAGTTLPGPAMAPRPAVELLRIEEAYLGGRPLSHVYLDGFLRGGNPLKPNPASWFPPQIDFVAPPTALTNILPPSSPPLAALRRLQEWCVSGTIWYEIKRDQGYLGSYLDDGFSTPLLYQIAEELREAFPRIFRDHPLQYAWAYKYDDGGTFADGESRGIGLHGDEAAVNVNFWITPEEANLDKDSGGLVIHRVAAPLNWTFNDYNDPKHKARLEAEVAHERHRAVVVPYRENRMVMFNSSLFHETDKFRFKPGFANRRINLTMLFGRRGRA